MATWLEIGNQWFNLEHVVRVEFSGEEKPNLASKVASVPFQATIITVKPGGSDRTLLQGDDARKIKAILKAQPSLGGENGQTA
jgi:hypothetical protein